MTELLPCPHCGETEHLYPAYRLKLSGALITPPYAIDCLGCGHDFTPREGVDARDAWNRRAPLQRQLADELSDLATRFERALVHSGSDVEFAQKATEKARELVAKAEDRP